MEKVMGALMIMCGEMREPVLHGAGIPQPAALNIAHPATQAGRDGKQQNGLWITHRAFGDQHADQINRLSPQKAAGSSPFSRNKIINNTKYNMPIMEGLASVSKS